MELRRLHGVHDFRSAEEGPCCQAWQMVRERSPQDCSIQT